MIRGEVPFRQGHEYEALDNETIHRCCRQIETLLDQAPDEKRVTTDMTRLTRLFAYPEPAVAADGQFVPIEHEVSLRAYHFERGLIRAQYEVVLATVIRRPLQSHAVIDNELYWEGVPEDELRILPRMQQYTLLVGQDGFLSAYVEAEDLSHPEAELENRAMVRYDAVQLDAELRYLEGLHTPPTD